MLMNLMNRFETCSFETCFQSYRTQLKAKVWLSCLNMRTNAACAGKQPCWASKTWITGVCIWKSKAHNERLSESLQYSSFGKTNFINILYIHIYTYRQSSYIHISSIVSRKFYRYWYKHIYRFKTTKCSMLEEWIAGLNPDTFTLLSVRTGNPGKRRFGVISWYV